MQNATMYPHYFKPVPTNMIDVYRVLLAFGVTDPALQHAIKKLLCAGARGNKDIKDDIGEAIASCNRALQMISEDETFAKQREDDARKARFEREEYRANLPEAEARLQQFIAQGYTTDRNATKEMDVDLVQDMAHAVYVGMKRDADGESSPKRAKLAKRRR